MIVRLTLTDFMAHGRTEFLLAPGLNVLTGPNNTGKSAVVEALRCLSENPPPKHVIRHGAPEARVEAELEDGVVVTWVRRPKYALYEVRRPGVEAPEVFAKFGRAVPEEVRRLLRLGPVALGGDGEVSVDVHIGNQREPVFLLNEPGTVMAGFFAASTEAAHLIAMQARLTRRATRTKTEKKRLEKGLAATAGSLDKLLPLPDLERRLDAAADLEATAAAKEAGAAALARQLEAGRTVAGRIAILSHIARTLGRLGAPPELVPTAGLAELAARQAALGRSVARAAGRGQALARLDAPPRLADTAALAARLAGLDRAGLTVARCSRRTVALAPLDEPPPLAETRPLAALAGRLAGGQAALAVRERRQAALAALAEPPAIADVAGLFSLVRALAGRRTALAALARRHALQAALAEAPEVVEVRPLAGLVGELSAARAAVAATGAALAARERALADFARRVGERLAALGACPLCGGEMTAEAFLGGGHSHGRPAGGDAA
ncbi:AAA family ATPase [Solidesulfovibrio sp.]